MATGSFDTVSLRKSWCRVVVKQVKGRGRHAIVSANDRSRPGGWLFRLYMAWFFSGLKKR